MKIANGEIKHQTDYLTISKRCINAVLRTKIYPSADCENDHCSPLVISKQKMKLSKLKKPRTAPKVQ